MKLEFVNHASVIFDYDGVVLITDPWYKGVVVNNGWDLLVESKFQTSDFEKITHIWFSHEHSDHFVPKLLNEISAEFRSKITVLYQKTIDKKVISYCKNKLNFKEVIELEKDNFFSLSENFKIKCYPHFSGDSWLYISTPHVKILNLNDCIVKEPEQALNIRNKIGDVDILLTQFGYANKIGNPNDIVLRKNAAKEKLNRIKIQLEILKPKYILPFASFSIFCNQDNSYMNNEQVTVNKVFDYVTNNFDVDPIILYPGDSWCFGEDCNFSKALKLYENSYSNISNYSFIKSESVTFEELFTNSIIYGKRLVNKNPSAKRLINKIKTIFFILDLNISVVFLGEFGFKKINIEKEKCDVIISSDSLNYILKFEWGGYTCVGNARYFTTKFGDIYKFDLLNKISDLNNQNLEFQWELPNFFNRIIVKLSSLLR
jgi:UDP-MurNAc hydroxylase